MSASALARLPIAMGSIALLLYVQRTTGTFAQAGVVSGSALAGVAAGSVLQGKLMDKFGPTRSLGWGLGIFVVVVALNFVAIEAVAPLVILALLAFCFGLSQPAVSPASRGIWARILPRGPVREAAYTYEAISLEIFFVLGPAIAGVLAASRWAGTGLLVTATLFVIGTILFITAPVVRRSRPAPRASVGKKALSVIRLPGIQTLILVSAGFGILLGVVEVVIPAAATAAGSPALGGLLLGAYSLTSVVFGIFYASRPWPRSLQLRAPFLLAAFAILVAVMGLPQTLLGLALAMLVAGLPITPQATLQSLLVDRVSPVEASGEAFAWVVTAVTSGLAIGQGVSGQLVETIGVSGSLGLAAIPGLLIAGIAWLRRDTLRSTDFWPESTVSGA